MKRQVRRQRVERFESVQALTAPRLFGKPIEVNSRVAPVFFCILLLSACAGPEKTFRDAHDVVTEVIDLTVGAQDATDTEKLYALEERVETACRPIFSSAHRQWVFGDIPFYAQLETLMWTHKCRRTVDEARRRLDIYHLERARPPTISPREGALIYSN